MTKAFYKITLALLLLILGAGVTAEEVLTVSSVDGDQIMVGSGDEVPSTNAIFDVYREADSDGVYRALVDSVYFVSPTAENGEWLFRSVWTGGGRYVEEGYLLVPTPRTFAIDSGTLESVVSVNTPPGTVGGASNSSTAFGVTAGVAFGSSIAGDQPAVGGAAEVFLRLGSFQIPLFGYARWTGTLEAHSGFDVGVGVPFAAPSNPELSATVGALGGRLTETFYDYDSGMNVEVRPAIVGAFLNLGFLPSETQTVGMDLSIRSYAALTDTADGPQMMFDVRLGAVYRIF